MFPTIGSITYRACKSNRTFTNTFESEFEPYAQSPSDRAFIKNNPELFKEKIKRIDISHFHFLSSGLIHNVRNDVNIQSPYGELSDFIQRHKGVPLKSDVVIGNYKVNHPQVIQPSSPPSGFIPTDFVSLNKDQSMCRIFRSPEGGLVCFLDGERIMGLKGPSSSKMETMSLQQQIGKLLSYQYGSDYRQIIDL